MGILGIDVGDSPREAKLRKRSRRGFRDRGQLIGSDGWAKQYVYHSWLTPKSEVILTAVQIGRATL